MTVLGKDMEGSWSVFMANWPLISLECFSSAVRHSLLSGRDDPIPVWPFVIKASLLLPLMISRMWLLVAPDEAPTDVKQRN